MMRTPASVAVVDEASDTSALALQLRSQAIKRRVSYSQSDLPDCCTFRQTDSSFKSSATKSFGSLTARALQKKPRLSTVTFAGSIVGAVRECGEAAAGGFSVVTTAVIQFPF